MAPVSYTHLAEMDWSEYADVNELFADGVNDITRYLRKRNSGTQMCIRDSPACVRFLRPFSQFQAVCG